MERSLLANCRTQLALVLRYQGKYAQALTACRLARADQEVIAGVSGASNDARRALAETIDMIGYLLWVSGRWEEAVPELWTAMVIYQKLVDENPDVIGFRRGLYATHFYLGNVLPLTGRPTEGEAEFRVSLEITERVVADNPAVTSFRRSLGLARSYFASLLLDVGKPAEAEAECREALALILKLVDEDSGDADFRSVLAGCHFYLGTVLMQVGNLAEAEVECRKAHVLWERLAIDDRSNKFYNNWCLALALNALGDVVRTSGRAAEAEASYSEAIVCREQLLKGDPAHIWYRYDLASSTWRRGLIRVLLGKMTEATADTRRALKILDGLTSRSGVYLFETASCHAVLAGLAQRPGSSVSAAEGEEAAARAVDWLRRAVANGYRNTNQLRVESALDPLRERPDFRDLMMDLAFPAEPFAPPPPIL